MIDAPRASGGDRMELRHLRHFVAIAEAGSMALAARRLHLSQPALSRQIQELERSLGVKLFDRVGRRIVLATDGGEMLARSRRLLAEAESFRERAAALGGAEGGVLRVGTTPQFLEAGMPEVLAAYRKRHPRVEVRVTEGGGDQLEPAVEQGELHLLAPTFRAVEPLKSTLLYPVRVLAVMSRRHRLATRRTLAVPDIANETLLMLAPGFGSRRIFDEACRAAGAEPRVLVESRSPSSLIAMAAAGHGIAIVPSVVRLSGAVAVAGLRRDGRALGLWAQAVWDPRRHLPAYATGFLQALIEHTRHSYPGHDLRLTREVRRPWTSPPGGVPAVAGLPGRG
jgi:DNA-binding transcriptional LysR family regulator